MANVLIQGSGGGGQKLAPLTTPATADKIKSGKEAYTDAGVKLTGSYVESLPTLNAPTITVSGNVVNIVDGDNGTFSKTWEISINNLPYRIIAHTGNYTFTELSDGTYSVKVKARGDGFNDSEFSNVETMTISTSSPIYGVSGLYDSGTSLTRTDDAVGMSWTMSNNEISSDFDDVFPYNEMTRETIGTNVFVKVPAIWWRVGTDSVGRITDIAVSETEMTPSTGQTVYQSSAFYYGAYKGYSETSADKILSQSGKAVRRGRTREQFRSQAQANGTGYQINDLYHLRIIQFLWLIEFATKNSQSVMIGGYAGNTGATDNLTTPSGQLSGSDVRMRYHYIEDLVGNCYEFIDGIAGHYVSANPAQYSDDLSATGTSFSAQMPYNNNNCLMSLKAIDANNPLLATPYAGTTNSSYNTYFCDQVVTVNNSYNYYPVYRAGSNSGSSAENGLFYMYGFLTTSADSYTAVRLLYIPQS